MSYNELYSRVACLPEAKNLLDSASSQSKETQIGYSTSARAIGVSTPLVKDANKKMIDSQLFKNNLPQRGRCIRANCQKEGVRLVAKTEIPFLIQYLGNEISPDMMEGDMRLCHSHYLDFRDANIKNFHATRKYDLLTPNMDPPSIYEKEVRLKEYVPTEIEPEEPENLRKHDEIPIDPAHVAVKVPNVVLAPKGDTLLDRIYHWLRQCFYGDPNDPCLSEISNFKQLPNSKFPKLRHFSSQNPQQPLIWDPSIIQSQSIQEHVPSGRPRALVHTSAVSSSLDQFPMQLQSPTSPSLKLQRDPVKHALASTSSLTREPTPLQHSLATSGINRRFGGGQKSEYQSNLFRTG